MKSRWGPPDHLKKKFHGEFHDIKFVDMAKREDDNVSWDVRRVSPS
jgi:hypothetical protein